MKKRIVAEHKSGQFAIPLKENEWVIQLDTGKYAVMSLKYLVESAHTVDTISQVFHADVFRVEDCCGGTDATACACK